MVFFPDNGPLRVRASQGEVARPAVEPSGQEGDEYFKRLVLLVPSEVLALYVTFKSSAADWLGIWALICLGLVIFVRTIGTRQTGKPIQWISVGVASVSFVLWIYATGGSILNFTDPLSTPSAISVAIGVWTFLIPYFYKGD